METGDVKGDDRLCERFPTPFGFFPENLCPDSVDDLKPLLKNDRQDALSLYIDLTFVKKILAI